MSQITAASADKNVFMVNDILEPFEGIEISSRLVKSRPSSVQTTRDFSCCLAVFVLLFQAIRQSEYLLTLRENELASIGWREIYF